MGTELKFQIGYSVEFDVSGHVRMLHVSECENGQHLNRKTINAGY